MYLHSLMVVKVDFSKISQGIMERIAGQVTLAMIYDIVDTEDRVLSYVYDVLPINHDQYKANSTF